MNEARMRAVEALFLEVSELAPEDRVSLLSRADPAVAAEVVSLLEFDVPEDRFLRSPVLRPEYPERVGPYRVLRLIGEGGFGTVWLAEQERPIRRSVALKLIRPGMDSRQVLARFEAERQALALMSHPGVAKVYEAGTDDRGHPYFVMEYVEGVPITSFCDQRRLDVRDRVGLLIQVCEAVQHAHTKGVIHRDIKPSNILVESVDGRPVAKVIDFGVAKAMLQPLTSVTLHTERGQLIGTPAYMSPEQARGTGLDIDTRADVYSLGAVLHELLTGAPPLDPVKLSELSFAAMLEYIVETEPARPSVKAAQAPGRSARRLKGDLDWIVLRCLAKERERRYDTAAELAADLHRFLDSEPVHAGPPSAAYRTRKFVKRNRAMVIGSACVIGVLSLGVIGTSWGLIRALDEQARTSAELTRANEVALFLKQMLDGISPEETPPNVDLLVWILEQAAGRLDRGEIEDRQTVADLRRVIGGVYYDLTLFDQAERQLVAARDTHVRVLGKDHPDTLRCGYELGLLLRDDSRYAEAEAILGDTLERQKRVLGEDHPDTIETMSLLGRVYGLQLRPAKSGAMLIAARELGMQVFDEDDRRWLELNMNLGVTYLALDDQRTASALLEEIPQDMIDAASREHEFAIGQMFSLYQRDGRLPEFEELVKRRLDESLATWGEGHRNTLVARRMLANTHESMGRVEEAEAQWLEAIGRYSSMQGEAQAETLQSKKMLALFYIRQGRLDDAAPLLRDAIDGFRHAQGGEYGGLYTGMCDLAWVYEGQGQLDEVRPLLRQVLGAGSPTRSTTEILDELVHRCEQEGVRTDALRLYRQVIDSGEKALAWPDPSTHALHYIALQLVTFGLEELREPELALRLAQRACTIESDTFGEASWFKLEALWLAQLQTGDLEEAAATRRRALARMEDSNPALAGSAEYFATLLALAEDDSVSSRTNALAWISILAPRPGGAQWAKVVLDREIRVMGEFAESSIPARHVLALLLADAGDFNEAEGLLRRNIELRIRTHGGARWQDELSLGVVLAELREHDEAMPLIERAYPSALDEPDPIRRAYYMRKTESAMADMTGHRR